MQSRPEHVCGELLIFATNQQFATDTLMIARTDRSRRTRLAPATTIYGTPSLALNARDYHPPRALAVLIRVAALLAPASFSKPNSAECLTERNTDQVRVISSSTWPLGSLK